MEIRAVRAPSIEEWLAEYVFNTFSEYVFNTFSA